MKHVVITVHGVCTPKQKKNWQDYFKDWCLYHSADVEVYSFKYGFWLLLPYISTLPKGFIFTKWVRDFYAQKLKAFIKSKMKKHPGARLHLIAHSYGTWISHEVIKDRDVPMETVSLVAGVISAHLDKNGLEDALRSTAVQKVIVWASKEDEVCHFAPPPFGHIGYWGAIDKKKVMDRIEPRPKPYDHLELYNRITDHEHNSYFIQETFNQWLVDILLP